MRAPGDGQAGGMGVSLEAYPAAVAAPTDWRWEVATDRADLDRLAPEWNALAHAGRGSLFSDATWIRAYRDAFLEREAVALHLLSRDGSPAAVLPLRRAGRAVPTWAVLANSHTPGPPVILHDRRGETYDHVLDHLLRSASVIDFGRLPSRGPLYERLDAAARRQGLRVAAKPTDGEAIIDLAGPWSELRGALSRSLRKNTERAERKLAGMGTLAFDVIEGPPALEGVLEECFDLETLGWKGERGSPIRSSASVLRFYTELARAAAAAGRFALYTLRLDGRLIAFEYCLRAQGQIALLKISFDPAVARQSPGHVLRFKILQRESEKGEISTYSMGPESQWKLHWATRVEPVVKVRVYGRSLLGRLAFVAGPGTRTVLGRSETLRRLARRVRDAVEAQRRRGRRRRSSDAR